MARSFSGSSPENLEEREIRTRNKIRPFQTIRAPGFGGKYTERRFLFENFEDATAQTPEFLRFPGKCHSLSSNGVMRHSSQLVALRFVVVGRLVMASKLSCDRLWILD
jgi:hypothetical protein